ncbi:MAG: [protein-PII] uridylyltransferase [Bauldia sp.]|nr:[protein-PII] uridylyltransferase [Bauldia sp.]
MTVRESEHAAAPADALIDAAALASWLDALAARGDVTSGDTATAILSRLKKALADGHTKAEVLLLQEGKGTLCARRLSDLQDSLIRVIHDFAGKHVVPPEKGGGPAMAVVAVGGYGRGTLAPGSDIDLLFLMPAKSTPRLRKLADYILYRLWDMGFKVGQATRTVDECIRLARSDMTIRTAVLEARFVCGDRALLDALTARFDKEVVKGTAAEFVAAKLAERDERHQKQGASRYLVEPNIKDGKGGLRDLHTLFWIAKYVYRTQSMDELVKAGVFSRAELERFQKAEEFLWVVRCNLHFLAGRAEERLSFEVQRPMAERLGYTDHPGMEDVERFMKHYFLVAKDVGDLTRIFCAALEEHHVKAAPRLGRLFGGRRRKKIAGSADFIVENDRLNIADDDVFTRDPVNLIRIFTIADGADLPLHPDATQRITRQLGLIDGRLRADPEANRLFVDLLASRKNPEATLRLMNETGVLGRFVPDFGKVVAMMQFNMYHHYTVDEHLIRAVGGLSRIERGELDEEHPLAAEIWPTLKDRTVLYIAMLLHDIAKGRPEDHSIAGARVARKLGPRFGLTPPQVDTLAWLVEHHLLMSLTAQQRDLNDPKTIQDFAAVVQDMERLKLLLILTIADIRAVGPGVWNGWKGQLLRTLYWETETVLTGGHSQVTRRMRVEAARRELAEKLADWPEAERRRYVERLYPAYLLRVDMPHKLAHAAMIREADREGRTLATEVTLLPFEAVTEITILAPDHPRLLSIIAGACAVAGANIVDAQIFTTTDGLALDSIFISREFADDEDEQRRARKIRTVIEEALSGAVRLPDRVVAVKAKPKPRYRAFNLTPRIVIDNSWSDQFTAIEASGLDRPGLLYDLTRILSDLNLNIASAHITTFGERAVDVFYVSDLIGQKVTNPARMAAIRRRLEQAFDPPAAAPKAPRRGAA